MRSPLIRLVFALLFGLETVPLHSSLLACSIPDGALITQALTPPDYGAQYSPGTYLNVSGRAAVVHAAETALSNAEIERLTPAYRGGIAAFFAQYIEWRIHHPYATLAVVVRHGEATSNVFKIVQDHETASPLSIRGVRQRNAFFRFMSAIMRRTGIQFSSYISSDLERAFETLRPLSQSAGREQKTLKRFREVKNLIVGGINYKLAFRLFPNYGQSFRANPDQHTLAPRYSIKRIRRYIDEFLKGLEQSPGKNVIIASHGNAIRLSMLSFLNIPAEKFPAMCATLGHDIQNVAITVLAFDPNTAAWTLLVYADNSYLPDDLQKPTERTMERLANRLRLWGIVIARATVPRLRKNPHGLADWFGSWRHFIPPSDRSVFRSVHRQILKYQA